MTSALSNATFWTALGAGASVVALWFVAYQIWTGRMLSAYALVRREKDTFRSPRMLRYRSEVAQGFLAHRPLQQLDHCAKHIASFFETLGMMHHKGLVPPEFIWESLSFSILRYWRALNDYGYIQHARAGDHRVYDRFENLYRVMCTVDITERGRAQALSQKDIQDFLRSELRVRYREYSPKDLYSVARLMKCSYTKHEALSSLRIERADFRGPDTFIVADRFGEVVGFVIGEVSAEKMGQVTHEVAQISYIAVDPSYRRLGIGSELLKAILLRFQNHGAAECIAHVHTDHVEALRLLMKEHFKMEAATTKDGKRTSAHSDTMRLQLKEAEAEQEQTFHAAA